MKKALFISFQLYICFIEFFSLFYFFFVHVLTVSYNMYKTLKMPAHWCIYKFMLYINFSKYLLYISEYNIYIYAFSRRFYPKRLTIAFRLYIFISKCVI